MTSLKWKKNPLGNSSMVGIYIPTATVEILQMLALSKGVSKSRLLRDMINDNIPKSKDDVHRMIRKIAYSIYIQWEQMDKSNRPDFQVYKKEIKKRHLKKYKLGSIYINLIMKEVDNLNAKNKVSDQ